MAAAEGMFCPIHEVDTADFKSVRYELGGVIDWFSSSCGTFGLSDVIF